MGSIYLKGKASALEYGHRIVKVFRIFIEKRMVNDYWIVYEFRIVSLFWI